MTEREAYRILGLSPGADGAELKRTYRRLMMQRIRTRERTPFRTGH